MPGQPLPKCLPPATTTASPARNSADGPSRPGGRAATTRHATGNTASTARAASTSIAADIASMAAVTPVVRGADHCQPVVSWDHMAPPTPAKTAAQQPSEARLALVRLALARCVPGAGTRPASDRPASPSRAAIPPRITSAVRDRDRGRSSMSATRSSANSSP